MLIFLVIPLLFVLFQNLSSEKSNSLNILKSILIFGFITFSITELLSLINKLNLYGLIISWLSIFIVLIFLIFKTKSKFVKFNLLKKINAFSIYEKSYLTIISLLFLLLFYQGIIYPPNNWDSLTYHMSRIMYWLTNENLNHFPTHILRHLYQPPFAEYLIMNVNVLQGNDYFSNSIQLLFLFFTLSSINEILKWFEINRSVRIITFLFCLSIPSVVLQATSSKNDIICAFFVITSILFLIKSYEKPLSKNFIFLGISVGLGMLTKGTFYIFIFPALLFFVSLFIMKILKQKTYGKILLGFVSVFFIFVINLGHFSRNYKVNQHILNIDDTEHKMYSNEDMNVKFFMSNLLKNIGLHMGYPTTYFYEDFLTDFHYEYEIFIDNPQLNFLGQKYQSPKKFETHEDLVPNTFHIILIIFISVLFLFISVFKKKYKNLILLIIVLLQIFIFITYLKWQPWHTRLHIPIFLMSSLIFGVFLNIFKNNFLNLILSIPFLFNFYFYLNFNKTRPLINNTKYTYNINVSDQRFSKYFANRPLLQKEYDTIKSIINKKRNSKIGFMLSDWEYPLINNFYEKTFKVYAINVKNVSSKFEEIQNVNYIISDQINEDIIIYSNKKYKNLTSKNNFIWVYSCN